MNRYLRKWIFYHLQTQKYIFILMTVQFVIATFILSIFWSASLAINQGLNELLQEQENTYFLINPVYFDENEFNHANFDLLEWGSSEIILNEYSNLPINQNDLQYLQQTFPELSVRLLVEVNLVVLTEYGTTFTIIYDSTLNNVQLTTGFYELIRLENHANIINVRDLHFTLDGNQIRTLDGLVFPIETIHSPLDNQIEYIKLPIEAYYQFHHPKNVHDTRLQVQISADFAGDNFWKISKILQYLHEQHGSYFNYYLSSDFAEFFAQVERASNESDTFTMMSLILLMVVSIGMSASFVILLNRQKKEIAIMLAMGTAKTALYLLSISQPIMISSLGAFIGLAVSSIVLSAGFQIATTVIYLNISALIGVFIFLQFLALLSSLPMILNIKKLMPIEFLRSE